MTVRELAAVLTGAVVTGDPATAVTGLALDSRRVRAGDAFFALAGVVVSDALARGVPSLRTVLRTPSGVVGAIATAAMLAPFTPEIPGAIDTLLFVDEVDEATQNAMDLLG